MKRFYIFSLLCSVLLLGLAPRQTFGQSFGFTEPPPATVKGTTDHAETDVIVAIKNISSTTKRAKIRMIKDEMALGHEAAFCFHGYCYTPQIDVSETAVELKPGESTSMVDALIPKLYNYGYPGKSKLTFVIFNEDNPDDKISVQFTFDITSTTTDIRPSFDAAPMILSNSYPSPAVDNARIDYNITQQYNNATLTVYNLIGNAVQTVRLDAPKGYVTLQTATMSPGVYFYSIVADGKKLATKKLIVKR